MVEVEDSLIPRNLLSSPNNQVDNVAEVPVEAKDKDHQTIPCRQECNSWKERNRIEVWRVYDDDGDQ